MTALRSSPSSTRSARTTGPLRRAAIAASLLLPLASGCSVEQALPIPSCADGGTTVLAAQSVPTANQVPCFDPLPDGWDVVSTVIDDDGTVIRFDSDRAGEGAAVLHYVDSCTWGAAVRVPSEYPDARQYELIQRIVPSFGGRRYHVFGGGCVWWDFDFDEGAGSVLSIELGDRLHLVDRAELNDAIRSTFIDEEV